MDVEVGQLGADATFLFEFILRIIALQIAHGGSNTLRLVMSIHNKCEHKSIVPL